MSEEKRACHGAPTFATRTSCGEMAECHSCGTAVRWDLVDHWFWGFQTCEESKARQDSNVPTDPSEAKAGK